MLLRCIIVPVKSLQLIPTRLGEGLMALLWPGLCDVCGESIAAADGRLCQNCWDKLLVCTSGHYCRVCGGDASEYATMPAGCGGCNDEKIHFDAIARAGVYETALRDMILAFKLNDRTELASCLCMLADSALQGSSFADQIDYFVPVPLHWRRQWMRGYNQSLLICKGLTHPTAQISTDLARIRYTQKQFNLSHTKRRRNVAGAFAPRKGHPFKGRNICLVDDISTSMATLNECAKTLKQAGADKVFSLVLAVAARGRHRSQPI